MSDVWNKFKGYLLAFGAFAALVLAFFFEKEKANNAEAKLDESATKEKDAVLAQHTADIESKDAQDKEALDKAKATNPTGQDLADELNKLYKK